jgi:hypothetical protein
MRKSRAKYRSGECIKDVYTLLKQDLVYFNDRIIQVSFVQNWQLRFTIGQLERGRIKFAVRKNPICPDCGRVCK